MLSCVHLGVIIGILKYMKKIYFACAITGGREHAHIYAELVAHIKQRALLLTETFADGQLTTQGMNKPSTVIYSTDIAWIHEADAVIADVTTPSLGVGYEIAKAEEWQKPVLALFNGGGRRLTAMIEGSPHIRTVHYETVAEATAAIDLFIAQLEKASS